MATQDIGPHQTLDLLPGWYSEVPYADSLSDYGILL